MAEPGTTTPTPPADEMHWGLFLHAELKDVRQELRDLRREQGEFRKEVAQQFVEHRKEVAQQFAEHRKEVAQQFAQVAQQFAQLRAEIRQDLRHNLIAMLGFCSILAAILVAFVEYRIPGG